MGTIGVLWTAALLALVACHTASASPTVLRSLIESESASTAWLGERDCPTQCDSSCSCITKKSACEAACQQCLYDGVPCGTKIQAPLKGRIITPVHLVNAAPATKTRFQQKAIPASSRSEASESSKNRTESSESSRLSPQSLFKPVPIRDESSRKSESSRRQIESSRRSESSRVHESSRHESTKRSESSRHAESSRRSESSRNESSKRESSESSRRKVHIPLQQDNKLAPLSRPDATAAKDKQSKLNQIVELQSKIIAMLQSQSSKQKQQLESQNQLIEQQKQQSQSLSSLLKRSESSKSESVRSESSRSDSSTDVAKRAALVKRLQEVLGLNSVVHPFFTSDASGIQILPLTVPVAIPKGTSLASLLGGTSSVPADVTSSLSKSSSSSSTASSASGSSSSAANKAAHEARLNRIVQVLEQLVGWVRTRRGQVGEDFGSEQHIAEVLEQASSLTQRN